MTIPRNFPSFDSDTCQHTEPGVEGEEEVLVVRREILVLFQPICWKLPREEKYDIAIRRTVSVSVKYFNKKCFRLL